VVSQRHPDRTATANLGGENLKREVERLRTELQQLKQQYERHQQGQQQYGYGQDNGDHEQVRDALRGFEGLYDFAPVSFLTLDRRGMILALNERAARLFAFPVEWLRDRPFLAFVAKRDVTHFLETLSRLRQTAGSQDTIDIDISISDRLIPVQIWIGSFTRGVELIYRLAILELTDVKSVEKELKETLNNWYSLVESAPDVIMTVDREGKIRFANRHTWGYLTRALVGTQLTDYISEKDRTRLTKAIATAFDRDESSVCEVRGTYGDKERWYSFGFGPGLNSSRRTDPLDTPATNTTTTVTIRDITAHKRTEQSLRASREQLREFAARLEQVREDERTRVAREIHDELGQALTILKMDLAWVQNKTGPNSNGARAKLKSMIAEVDLTIERVRKIVSELRPSILDELGLTAALEWQVSQFQERTGIRGIFESNNENFRLGADTAAALFRVVQEALTNVVRHADARQVRVSLKSAGRVLRIAITDNGKGIAPRQINDRKSFGIVGMRERVHRIGGEFNIFSGQGRGTRLEIAVPLK
jgi:PAS domain S-box-containing protein